MERVQFIEGELQDVGAFAEELSGCDALFHTATCFQEYYRLGDHWPKLKCINVQVTVELLEAAEKAGIGKAIYVSTSGCIGRKPDGSPGDETTPPGPITFNNLYFKRKLMSEQAIHAFLQRSRLPVVLICPRPIFGPADAAPTESGRFVQDFLNGKLPARLSGGTVPPSRVAERL